MIHPVLEERIIPTPLSQEIRHRFQLYFAQGLSSREADPWREFDPSEIRPPTGPWHAGAFSRFFKELIVQDADITLYELRDALFEAEGVQVHHSAIAKALARLGFTYKKSRWWPTSAERPASGVTG